MKPAEPTDVAPPTDSERAITVALVGNPNTGKSTLFGALVGSRQRVGNYPGVTVESRVGLMNFDGRRYNIVDLPGLYSLAPHSRDEMVVVELLLGRRKGVPPVELVLCVLDADNLHRGFYLLSQLLELDVPVVVAVNKVDMALTHGATLDLKRLGQRLPVPVMPIQANRQIGIAELKAALAEAKRGAGAAYEDVFPEAFEEEVARLAPSLASWCGRGNGGGPCSRWVARRLLLDVSGYLEGVILTDGGQGLVAQLHEARGRLARHGCPVPDIEPEARYDWAHRALTGVVRLPAKFPVTASDRIDRVLTHPIWGLVVFAVLMVVVFQSVFVGAAPLMRLIDNGVAQLGDTLVAAMAGTRLAGGAMESLLVHGVLAGVGGVVSFLPQIAVLFFFIAVLEGCGYMARAAFLMDKLMTRVGLSGRSFIPLLSSFACAIPGIMATRVIGNERDRLTTILVAPLMTCSARLPVYALLIAAFVPERSYAGGLLQLQGLTLAGLYALGIGTAVVVALVLRRTLLRGESPPLLMDMPDYQWPTVRTVFYRVVERAWVFVRTAGGVILAVSVLAWAALYYPRNPEVIDPALTARRAALVQQQAELDAPSRAAVDAELTQIDRRIQDSYQRQSILARLGRMIEPVVHPLGWDWRIGSAVIASFPAREAVVATLSVIFSQDDSPQAATDDGDTHLAARLREATWANSRRPLFTLPVALSIMVFYALCAQCAATLAVIRRETNSWRWPIFAFSYMTLLAYVGALMTYQFGTWLSG